jgi:ankyrin repeat protein
MRSLLVYFLMYAAATAHSQSLHELASTAPASELRAAVVAGADPNVRDAYGQTPLMYAADNANLEAFHPLVSEGADSSAKEAYGRLGRREFRE